ncbi:bifunctional copper resistance protein CopD/cytochrome c oxidase assembly protein [Salinibacterium sp. NSLL150]|nr:bifunctional copper resistance protein CopD/cytochrome c oxidase assembly protein [Salinibacterium sp. NSLL35]MBH0100548.1 bifunctional copper resistance protein CopD/cytochrome c oxidase assembly protein [Salinibacterium sp. NSLL150]MBH0103307.1 bifunctional copper resistance protein CopD/cytochrome c oxidase assembly protein [Salinibacterium sp. NSLL16]MBH0106068.1 bifunctional copper resistance protein CopD/cytochrome c oxidase assembly protein [Salinibacterium sp. NSLL17]
MIAVFAMSPKHDEFTITLDFAAAGAAVWAVASAITGFFTFLAVRNQPIDLSSAFGDVLASFLTSTEVGQAWLATVLIAAVVTVLCFAVRNMSALVFVLVLSVAGLIPMALQGHSGGTADHDAATSAIFLHLIFAALWLGGLLAIAIARPTLTKDRLSLVLRRYSSVALVSFIVVAASGYVSAEIRVENLTNLLSPYGILVLVKVFALIVLGLFGAVYRNYAIGRLEASPRKKRGWFWWIVTAELAFMGLASGAAAALAATPTPVPEIVAADLPDSSSAAYLTGSPLPPTVTASNLFTLWSFDLIWVLICAFAIFFYLAGVWRLHKRGDSWPIYRTVFWVLGMLLLFYITNGGVNVYEGYLFSMHMLGHMTLGMMIPVLLVPGAPVTLAMRAITKRTDGSRGAREWILRIVHSRYMAAIGHPVVAALIFVVSLWVFYYTPLFRWASTDHVGHEWMIIHFLASGYLFVQSLIGIDPSPHRTAFPIRLLILLATMAFHAFFGLGLMTGTGLLLADWYGAMGWDNGVTALEDQRIGGGIAWSVGEIPTIALAISVAIMWSRSDRRASVRYDRKADRDGDAELDAYNEMLAKR